MMTWTIKLTDGGITFKNGIVEMVGIKNQTSRNEVEQRTEIRFKTQTRSNLLHPTDGFDAELIFNGKQIFSADAAYPIEGVIVSQIRATLAQDSEINYTAADIMLERSDRFVRVDVNFHLTSSGNDVLKFIGGLQDV